MRALGCQLPGLSEKPWDERRAYPPGIHGGARPKKPSVFGYQLKEKQKLRYNYGILERQFRRYIKEAFRQKGQPGQNLMILLERRLDNVVFRSGFARSIPFARQLVTHGHILVNGRKTKSPSFLVKPDQQITLSEKAQEMGQITHNLENPALFPPDWLTLDTKSKQARVVGFPDAESLPLRVDIGAVIEYYSR